MKERTEIQGEKSNKVVFDEKMVKNFQKLLQDRDLPTSEGQQNLDRIRKNI